MVWGNEHMISVWPVRTGVLVDGDDAFCCAGVFPSETVYLCCVDAKTGEPRWTTPLKDLPAQGYLLATAERLYVTTGRERPVVWADRRVARPASFRRTVCRWSVLPTMRPWNAASK